MIKKSIWMTCGTVCLLAISSASFADYTSTPAPYVGIQLGWGHIDQSKLSQSSFQFPPLTITSFSNSGSGSGFAGRVYGGYQFDPMWAAELGWTDFTSYTSRATATYSNGAVVNASGKIRANAVDLVAKGTMYLDNNFNAFAKLGAAYMMQRGSVNGTAAGIAVSGNQNINRILPTFGLGVGYNFACNLTTDLSWNRIQKVGSSNISSTDLVSIGLNYKFI